MKKVEKDKECRVVRREFDLINAKKIKAVDISDFMCAM
jgi:NAD(P)-dependent dehydrogenase (short-subunit alcohol dehydrogenase family)